MQGVRVKDQSPSQRSEVAVDVFKTFIYSSYASSLTFTRFLGVSQIMAKVLRSVSQRGIPKEEMCFLERTEDSEAEYNLLLSPCRMLLDRFLQISLNLSFFPCN